MKSFYLSASIKGATRAASLRFLSVSSALVVFLVSISSPNLHALEAESREVHTLEEIVVVANGEETAKREVGSSVTVITSEQIENSQKQSFSEILRDVPGLDVVQTGARGGLTSVFMRGANSGHTLVIIDGIEMNDPSSPNGAFDFADLSVDNIERIEVLRGSQSVLYGSDAIGGVISIITKSGVGAPKTTLSANYGSYSTSKLSVTNSGTNLRTSYSISASRSDTKGFSATESLPVNEADAFGLTSLSGKLVVRPNANAQLRFTIRSSESETELDKAFGSFTNPGVFDDVNSLQRSRKSYARAEIDVNSQSGVWRGKASANFARSKRAVSDANDAVYGFGFQSAIYESETSHFTFKGILTPRPNQRLIVGAETERESLSQTTDYGFGESSLRGLHARTTGVYALAQLSALELAYMTLGIRNDDHQRFGNHTSFRATGAIVIPDTDTRLIASLGDGFNSPSLFQLFDPFFGNRDLLPEVSESWDVGIEQRLNSGKVSFGATWFHQSISNIFGSDSAFKTINVASAKSEGAEIFADYRQNNFSARVDFTYTDAVDKSDGAALIRRPKNKVVMQMTYDPTDKTSFGLNVLHIGARFDMDFETFPNPARRVTLSDYTLVGFTYQQSIFAGVTFTERIDNVFNEEYQDVLRYSTSGRAIYFGVRYSM